MQQLLASIRKEALLLRRDPHALLLLFAMPAVFILIMSLAMQDQYRSHQQALVRVLVVDADQSPQSIDLLVRLANQQGIALTTAPELPTDVELLAQQLRQQRLGFALSIAAGFGADIATGADAPARHLRLVVAADTDQQRTQLLLAALREGLGRLQLQGLLEDLGAADLVDLEVAAGLQISHLYQGEPEQVAPSAVQQSVPAWLVFALFFVVIPLSNTMIKERQLGMERRLRTLPLDPLVGLLGKLLPYFFINQVQVVVMFLIGIYLVPALGGDALSLVGASWSGLALMAVSLSVAALGYGLLIAVICRTTEQTTMLGGAGNIILAAIGGIMVPKFVMPPLMQQLTLISPMSWGLDGLLVVLLHGGGPRELLPYAGALVAFGMLAVLLARGLQRHSA